jgi:riboflavin synthase
MFTGLIEKRGEVICQSHRENTSRLVIRAPFGSLQLGESIAINGVCLTLVGQENDDLMFDVSPETLKLTTLGDLIPGKCVNIEQALLATSRFGGHYVSGHVDTTAVVRGVISINGYIEMTVGDFGMPAAAYVLPKGSITLDGISLTINAVCDGCIKLMLVPHTLAMTTLSLVSVGDRLNVEFDYLTRIVAHQLQQLNVKALID